MSICIKFRRAFLVRVFAWWLLALKKTVQPSKKAPAWFALLTCQSLGKENLSNWPELIWAALSCAELSWAQLGWAALGWHWGLGTGNV